MKFGVKYWGLPIPTVVKYIAGVALSISMGITGYSYFNNDDTIMKIGGAAFFISMVLPKLFGVDIKKEMEEKLDEK